MTRKGGHVKRKMCLTQFLVYVIIISFPCVDAVLQFRIQGEMQTMQLSQKECGNTGEGFNGKRHGLEYIIYVKYILLFFPFHFSLNKCFKRWKCFLSIAKKTYIHTVLLMKLIIIYYCNNYPDSGKHLCSCENVL